MATAQLGTRFQHPASSEPAWPAFEYRVDLLDGIPEGGNGYHDLTIWIGDHQIQLAMPDGWGSVITIDGQESDEDEFDRLITWACVADLETAIIWDYLQHIGESEQAISDYWSLEGMEAQDGRLQPADQEQED
jgi:hypothetical protein